MVEHRLMDFDKIMEMKKFSITDRNLHNIEFHFLDLTRYFYTFYTVHYGKMLKKIPTKCTSCIYNIYSKLHVSKTVSLTDAHVVIYCTS
jgi:hypothetical protein